MADWDDQDLEADLDLDDDEPAYSDLPEEVDFAGLPPASGSDSRYFAWAIWAAGVLVAITATIFFYQRMGSEPPASEPVTVAEAAVEPGPEESAEAEPDEPPPPPLPALAESDALLRGLLEALTSNPALTAFFVDEGLVRRGVVILVNVAEGDDPTRHVRHLVPEEKFAVVRRGAQLYIDRESYGRYDGLAEGFASLDAAGTAELYRRIKPLVDEAHRELGYLDQPFETTLATALQKLADVPVIEGSIAVYPVSVNYQYEDPRLAKLDPAQRLLLRMGPRNVEKIQAKLRELADAFGISL